MIDWSNREPPLYFCGGNEPTPFSETEEVIAFRRDCLNAIKNDPSDDVSSYQLWLANQELKERVAAWSMLSDKSVLLSYLSGTAAEK